MLKQFNYHFNIYYFCQGDEIIGFCTEGTPANISTATSHSDLSMIAASEDGSETNVILRQSLKTVNSDCCKNNIYLTIIFL